MEENVKIPIEKIIQALDLIGKTTIAKVTHDIRNLSREERIIRFFYNEFLKPFADIQCANHAQPDDQIILRKTQTSSTQTSGNVMNFNEDTLALECNDETVDETACSLLPPYEEERLEEYLAEPNSLDVDAGLSESNNLQNEENTLSQTLKLPPVPHRSGQHRKYKSRYFPVLTAGERLAEIEKKRK
ncbi:uncharacterized protein LOC125768312 [Anopheles funestus]|uniref:uncharacterized protein LOC125768312 n=1 Tax=Anopheles funestus TaxID=62324 RepID=UPI0020C6F3F7|nr:uncharacterized protein LOC125768312 [Anopheles funestus]